MIRTVGELIAELQMYEDGREVRFATQPSYPLQHAIGGVAAVDLEEGRVVYIGAGDQLGYAPGVVSDALWF